MTKIQNFLHKKRDDILKFTKINFISNNMKFSILLHSISQSCVDFCIHQTLITVQSKLSNVPAWKAPTPNETKNLHHKAARSYKMNGTYTTRGALAKHGYFSGRRNRRIEGRRRSCCCEAPAYRNVCAHVHASNAFRLLAARLPLHNAFTRREMRFINKKQSSERRIEFREPEYNDPMRKTGGRKIMGHYVRLKGILRSF